MNLDVIAALATLDDRHRDALVVLALDEHVRCSRAYWMDRSSDAGITGERGTKLQNAEFKSMVEKLRAAGSIRRDEHGLSVLDEAWLVPILEDAHRRGRLAPLARGLRSYDRYVYSGGLGARGELRVALVSRDADSLARAKASLQYYRPSPFVAHHPVVEILGLGAPLSWIAQLDAALRITYLRDAADRAFVDAEPLGEGALAAVLASDDEQARAQLAAVFALAGEAERAHAVLEGSGTSQWTRSARAFVALTQGKLSEARELFAAAAVGARGQRVDLANVFAVFDVLLAVTSDKADEVADVVRRMQKGRRFFARFPVATQALEDLEAFRKKGKSRPAFRIRTGSWLDDLVLGLARRWMRIEHGGDADLARHAERARKNGYVWLAAEIERARSVAIEQGSLGALFGRKEGWELVLDSLRAAASNASTPKAKSSTPKKKEKEIWWTVSIRPDMRWVDIEAFAASGPLAKGTSLTLRRVLEEPSIPVTEHDRRVAERLARSSQGQYSMPVSVLAELVGHPRVRDAAGRTLTVETGEPKLRVERTSKGARVVLVPSVLDSSGYAVEREGDRLVMYTRTPIIARILEVLPKEGLVVPRSGLARMNETLGAMGALIGVDTAAELTSEDADADPRLHVQLFRTASGMRVRMRVVPVASGPALRPGAPPAETVVHRDGALVRVARNLEDERARLDALLERCPTLASLPRDDGDLLARDLESCLELLVELREAESDAVIEWLEGDPLRAPSLRSGSQLNIRVKGDSTWLSVEGEVRVDEQRVLGMNELLEAASRARGRFIPIGADEWLALTEDIKKKLDALGRVSALDKGGRISASLLTAIDGMLEGFDVSYTEEVEKRRSALERARDLVVSPPRDLEAELRDYQRDGFAFLARRTEAGLGACLADDMGLGKTVQALALLLHRRKKGPALVVAPMSVCRNWEAEARRFAPALSILRLADADRKGREAMVNDAKRADVVISSYGLLTSEATLLAGKRWGTVIFDEAHALKNASSRRWGAARGLDADAVVALTGTPVENRATELHALFDLLIPGMLGTRTTFERALGDAIADGSREAAAVLRQIIRPFVLRRTKAQVLSELPPKTEILHVVPPSEEHLAFYEAVRRRALEKIEKAKAAGGAHASRARIELLAEIMRLRRAAIDPRLVGGPEAPPGGKLDALVALATELREEGRRALVFSQFLEVLDLARERLEAEKIECLRLDGTMTESVRADAVSNFQSGRGDVFLVSLKAGGVGMNLTAADVVILLDPWWNPAVEDQAAGRAHRIGQTRPVTVARIVTERTIEEKVLALHAKKRQLFDDVVAGADGAGTLDVATISALLTDDWPTTKSAPSTPPASRGTPSIVA